MNARNEEFENYNSLYNRVVTEEKIHFVETGGDQNPEEEVDKNEIINNIKYLDEIPVNEFEIVNPHKSDNDVVKEGVGLRYE